MKAWILSILVIYLAFSAVSTLVAQDVTFSLHGVDSESNEFTVVVGETFDVKVLVDVGSLEVNGAEAYLTFDDTYLSLVRRFGKPFVAQDFMDGEIVQNDTHDDPGNSIAGFQLDYEETITEPGVYRTGSGWLATVRFQANNPGTTDITIDIDLANGRETKVHERNGPVTATVRNNARITIIQTTLALQKAGNGSDFWADVGESFDLQVILNVGVRNIIGIELRLTFDDTYLEVQDKDTNTPGIQPFVQGNLLGGSVVENTYTGTQLIYAELLVPPGVSGQGLLATATFITKLPVLSTFISVVEGETWITLAGFMGHTVHPSNIVNAEVEIGSGFDLELLAGWNIISLPVQPTPNEISSVLAPIADNCVLVWAYDGQLKRWLRYVFNGPSELNDLNSMGSGKGYCVYMAQQDTLRVSGGNPGTIIQLIGGWNFAGYNLGTEKDLADALYSIDQECRSVFTYDSANQRWFRYIKGAPSFLNNLDRFRPGWGYWIHVDEDCTWDLSQ